MVPPVRAAEKSFRLVLHKASAGRESVRAPGQVRAILTSLSERLRTRTAVPDAFLKATRPRALFPGLEPQENKVRLSCTGER